MRKYVSTYIGNGYPNGKLFIVCKDDNSLKVYRKLAREARKDFPDLKFKDVKCILVRDIESNTYMAAISFYCLPSCLPLWWTNEKNWERVETLPFKIRK